VLEQELEEAMPDHSVPDHDEVLLRHGPANTSKLGATRDAARSPLGTPGLTSGASDKIVGVHVNRYKFVMSPALARSRRHRVGKEATAARSRPEPPAPETERQKCMSTCEIRQKRLHRSASPLDVSDGCRRRRCTGKRTLGRMMSARTPGQEPRESSGHMRAPREQAAWRHAVSPASRLRERARSWAAARP
jgi:hypothetical protein